MSIPAWRVAWFHPRHGHWHLATYEYRELEMAEEMVAYLIANMGMKATLIPCTTESTGHGVDLRPCLT